MIASDTDSFDNNSNDSGSFNNEVDDIDQENNHLDDELSNNSNNEELDLQEENIQNELDTIEFGKILKANERINRQELSSKYNNKSANKSKKYLINKFDKINKEKKQKQAPKENSALVKPSKLKQYKIKGHQQETQGII